MTIYNVFIQFLLSWIIPFGFASFYPTTHFLGRNSFAFISIWCRWLRWLFCAGGRGLESWGGKLQQHGNVIALSGYRKGNRDLFCRSAARPLGQGKAAEPQNRSELSLLFQDFRERQGKSAKQLRLFEPVTRLGAANLGVEFAWNVTVREKCAGIE